jgi:hypothetical protein
MNTKIITPLSILNNKLEELNQTDRESLTLQISAFRKVFESIMIDGALILQTGRIMSYGDLHVPDLVSLYYGKAVFIQQSVGKFKSQGLNLTNFNTLINLNLLAPGARKAVYAKTSFDILNDTQTTNVSLQAGDKIIPGVLGVLGGTFDYYLNHQAAEKIPEFEGLLVSNALLFEIAQQEGRIINTHSSSNTESAIGE